METIKDPFQYIKQRTIVDEVTGCWEWTQSRQKNGYGRAYYDKKDWGAHRLSYTAFKGDIPEGLHVLHSCDNRGCCNPQHLRVGTPQDNMNDKVLRGRSNKGSKHGRAKLKESDVLEIRKLLQEGMSGADIGRKFGVTKAAISQIKIKRTWKHLTDDMVRKGRSSSKLSIKDVLGIKIMLQQGFKQKDIAKEYGVTIGTISHIKTGRQWSHL